VVIILIALSYIQAIADISSPTLVLVTLVKLVDAQRCWMLVVWLCALLANVTNDGMGKTNGVQ
jgi:hypothetical protein